MSSISENRMLPTPLHSNLRGKCCVCIRLTYVYDSAYGVDSVQVVLDPSSAVLVGICGRRWQHCRSRKMSSQTQTEQLTFQTSVSSFCLQLSRISALCARGVGLPTCTMVHVHPTGHLLHHSHARCLCCIELSCASASAHNEALSRCHSV